MNTQLESLLASSNEEAKMQQKKAARLVNKWQKTGLLEGIDNKFERANMAVFLENQAKQLIKEANVTGTSANSEQWQANALPLVRRTFGDISTKEYVSVQSMQYPSGLAFFLDFKYATAQPGFTTTNTDGATVASTVDSGYYANSVFGATNVTGDPQGGLYGTGRFGYTINERTKALTATSSAAVFASTANIALVSAALSMVNDAAIEDFGFDSRFTNTFSGSIAAGHFKKITVKQSDLTTPDLLGVAAFQLTGTDIVQVIPQFTKINGTNISFVVSGSISGSGASGAPINVLYHIQPTPESRGDFEDRDANGTSIGIPEINLDFKSEPIVAKTRKLKTTWTPEISQDLSAYHSFDIEPELNGIMASYISMEQDLEIYDMLRTNAVTVDFWSAKIGMEFDAATRTFKQAAFNGTAYTQPTWFQTLSTKINKVANVIGQKTLNNEGANFMIVSPNVATILESISGFAADTDGTKETFNAGTTKIGLLNSRLKVYKMPYLQNNEILIGYKGSSFLQSGAVFAPYVPLITTPVIMDPVNFTPRMGMMTRYAKKMLRPEFYGLIKIHGLDQL